MEADDDDKEQEQEQEEPARLLTMIEMELANDLSKAAVVLCDGADAPFVLTLAAPLFTPPHEPSTSRGVKLGALLMRELISMTPNYRLHRRMNPAFAQAVDAARAVNAFTPVLLLFAERLQPPRFVHVCAVLYRMLVSDFDRWNGCPAAELPPASARPTRATQVFGWEVALRLVVARRQLDDAYRPNVEFAFKTLCSHVLSDPCHGKQ